MTRLALSLACGPYDRTEALRLGVVQVEGVDLTYVPIQSPPEIFARMVKAHAFDAAEMSTAHYLTLKARGPFPYVAIPVFPSRLFRHGFIFVNRRSGIRAPNDLEGRRIGVQEYRQTAAVWIRGILADEYGVSFANVHWVEGGVDAPRRTDDDMDLRPLVPVALTRAGEGETLNGLLAAGRIDALIGARRPSSLGSVPDVVRLFEDYRAVERSYFIRTGIYPIMHTIVLREDLLARQPWLAESLFKAFVAAKSWALREMRFSGAQRFMLPWMFHEIDEIDRLFGGDPWPYGIEPNRKTLETLMRYLADQRFVERVVPIDPLFAPIVGWEE
ncbi:MAG: ABC transporter substrate-binding protein [Alphaproteobacteria bacterium]|nr:ABC transporter substrate-binding protein [Alphaproteobacteria bacterium]